METEIFTMKRTVENIVKAIEENIKEAYKIILKIGSTLIAVDYGLRKSQVHRVGDIVVIDITEKELVINFRANELEYIEINGNHDKIIFFKSED